MRQGGGQGTAGSHQLVVTYDLQLVQKDKLNFHFFQLKNWKKIKLAQIKYFINIFKI